MGQASLLGKVDLENFQSELLVTAPAYGGPLDTHRWVLVREKYAHRKVHSSCHLMVSLDSPAILGDINGIALSQEGAA